MRLNLDGFLAGIDPAGWPAKIDAKSAGQTAMRSHHDGRSRDIVRPLLHVHCELGPVLVNRTAAYRMCKEIPLALVERGFRVTCSALLARVGVGNAEPLTRLEQRRFARSQRWLRWASTHPALFYRTCRLTVLALRCRCPRGVRLFLDPLYILFYGAPDTGVVIVHDTTPVTDPSWHHPGVCQLYEIAYARLARSRCHLVTPCQNTADQLRLNWGIAPSRLTVLHEGLFALPKPHTAERRLPDEPYLLFVGTLETRKNVAGLIRAYADSGLYATRGVRLRLVGDRGDENGPIVALARATPGVDLPGFVRDAELAAAYAHCFAFVYPSFCEGFGLPLLEAMARGCLCLSTITGASPEVAGDAAVYVNPYDVADITRGLRRLVELPAAERKHLQARSRQRAATFTWERFHNGLAAVLEHAAAA